MQWSPQQADALLKIKRWARDASGPQVMRVFGFAGSGKTTMAKEIANDVQGQVLYMTFTGKAALVLRKKGCADASTIHSAIYKPEEDPVTGHTEFKLNKESPVAYASLVVVDEVSMVGEDIGLDLLSYGTKVLVLGDPFQLPPIRGDGFFTDVEPDIMLTEIHRQAAENPIIRMSMDVREGRGLVPGWYGESRVVRRSDLTKDAMGELVMSADQLLCGMNKTRQTFNTRVRHLRGIEGYGMPWHPTDGDKLVCLKNNRVKGLLNGGLWEAGKIGLKGYGGTSGQKITMRVTSLDEDGVVPVDVETPAEFFDGTEKTLDWRTLKQVDHFTYGYALTVHKSQGSQWDSVLLYDESSVFQDTAARHRYTGITRAAENVTVVV